MGVAAGRDPRSRLPAGGLIRGLLGAVLLLVLLLPAGCSRGRLSRGFPDAPPAAQRASGRLQEVAPPAGVQQLERALAERRPRVSITAPTDGSLLPASGWTLEITGADWPLADAGELGLGAHIVVQVDDEPPLRLTGEHRDPDRFQLSVAMPELSPGSHRLTVYAARPWGEGVKSPGASAQIRLHRAVANPLALPAPGTPQLIVTAPSELSTAEPVLVDWLLRDAPLQGLREGDQRWRLRLTINGDSVLVDQNAPLWLKGWRSGSNSVLLELVDPQGEPINPPFNSVVREVVLSAGAARPAWFAGPLSDPELATLLGEAPAIETEGAVAEPADDTPLATGDSETEEQTQTEDSSAETAPEPPSAEESFPVDGSEAPSLSPDTNQADDPRPAEDWIEEPGTSVEESAEKEVEVDVSLEAPVE